MSARTRGRWWLNAPWYTDWALWVGAALWATNWVTVLVPVARETPIAGSFGVVLLVVELVAGVAVWAVLAVLLRGLCRALFRVPPGPLGRPRSLRVPVHSGAVRGAVVYTRNHDGRVTARVEGLPPVRHAEALAATRERAASAGFVRERGAP